MMPSRVTRFAPPCCVPFGGLNAHHSNHWANGMIICRPQVEQGTLPAFAFASPWSIICCASLARCDCPAAVRRPGRTERLRPVREHDWSASSMSEGTRLVSAIDELLPRDERGSDGADARWSISTERGDEWSSSAGGRGNRNWETTSPWLSENCTGERPEILSCHGRESTSGAGGAASSSTCATSSRGLKPMGSWKGFDTRCRERSFPPCDINSNSSPGRWRS